MNGEITSPTAAREARWFSIPAMFAALMFLALILKWWPAAMSRAQEPFGLSQVIAGDLILAWKCFLRCAVAYVLTAIAFDWLTPIRWKDAVLIAIGAVIAELTAETLIGALLGATAGVGIQLIASAIAYAATMSISLWLLRRRLPTFLKA
jgi:hypothetical protein